MTDNEFRGYIGIAFEQWFYEPMDCRLRANNVSETDFVGVGPGGGGSR